MYVHAAATTSHSALTCSLGRTSRVITAYANAPHRAIAVQKMIFTARIGPFLTPGAPASGEMPFFPACAPPSKIPPGAERSKSRRRA